MQNNYSPKKYHYQLNNGWEILSSDDISAEGNEISLKEFKTVDWQPSPVPGTVMNSLVKNGLYPDIFVGDNLKKISSEPFEVSWWFRNEFEISKEEISKNCIISFDGINYKASIWLNGNLIANDKIIEGPFRRFQFEITDKLIDGSNVLALEVFSPKPGQFSVGFVDWNPRPPDRNMGIFRPVTLHFFDDVRIENPFIESTLDVKTLQSADLNVSVELVNYSKTQIDGILKGTIENIQFEQPISLSAGEKKLVQFDADSYPKLRFLNPRIWWPNNLGRPNMYEISLSFTRAEIITDTINQTFGIRSVKDYLTEDGHRGFIINGKKTLIKGAGWTDDIFLGDSAESLEVQINYVKHMNLNCIRLEGLWGKDHTLYDLCDKNGILIMAGWSCHWEHELHLGKPVDPRYGGITEPDEIDLIAKSWEDQIIWLRNHPSIFVWSVGSDMVPHPDLEKRYFKTFEQYDSTRAYLNSTGGVGSDQNIITKTEIISDISGSSGVKMLGPYDHTPPEYWFTNTHLGGAYGFNTETCPGANVPPLVSLKRIIPPEDLWPVNKVWDYHCALYEFGTLDRFTEAIDRRYGKAKDLEDFVKKSQLMNYELMRPMFEAFQANKGNATGIIQWMLNSAWPAIYWQLYDYYLVPNGAYYGTKKACEPLHLLYHYGDNTIYMINDLYQRIKNFKAVIRLFNIKSEVIFDQTLEVNVSAESATQIFSLPEINDLSTTYFLDLRLINERGEETGNNFYWLSTKPDVLNYEYKFDDFAFYTPTKEFADLTLLNNLAPATVDINHEFNQENEEQFITVDLTNSSEKIAFFNELIITGKNNGQRIIPVYWEDNYITLLPGEKRLLKGTFTTKDLKGDIPELKVEGWNISSLT